MKQQTEQAKELMDLGFSEDRQRRGIIKWVLAASFSLNIYLVSSLVETNSNNERVMREVIKRQLDTKKDVDSSIKRL